jgi:zinc transport system substrate-binding protein
MYYLPIIIVTLLSYNIMYVYPVIEGSPNISDKSSLPKLNVVASFYPWYEFTKKIGGEKIQLSTAIPFGVEPHEWEPSPQKISELNKADIIIYNSKGFDSWLKQFTRAKLIDVSTGLQLIPTDGPEKHSYDDNSQKYDHHIWLDPISVKNITQTISNQLIKLDPINRDYYKQNTNTFIKELNLLDKQIRKSLINCELHDFITFHESFHYFANRYGLTQHPVHQSLSSEGEILPQQIIKIISLTNSLGIDTIYSEELKDQRLSQTFASEISNGKVLLLSPIEGIGKEDLEKNIGYVDKMKDNIENLAIGLKCNL